MPSATHSLPTCNPLMPSVTSETDPDGFGAAAQKPRPLPMSAYRYVFPIPEAVLKLQQHTESHEAALAVMGAHVTPWDPEVPREASLEVLQHALGVVPAFR